MKTAIANDLLGSNFSLILAILLLFTIVIYIPVIIMFFFRRKTQPIRHRSPYLILTTLICKLLIKLASFLSGISISMIFYLDFKAESEWKSFTCKFYSFVGNVLHFTLILPFIFRSNRLVSVFDSKYLSMSNGQKNKLREEFYLKILAIVFSCFLFNFFLMMSNVEYNSYFPLEIEICCKSDHFHTTLVHFIWFFIHIFEVIIIFYYILLLKAIKDEFNISSELLIVGIAWSGFEILFLINNYSVPILSIEGILITDLLKNYLIFVTTGLMPIIRSYQRFYLPICTTKECASNFNLLLMNEKTFNSFYYFLRDKMSEGAKLLNFWIDINLFRHNQRKNSKVQILASDLYEKYIKQNAELYIDFPSNLVEGIHKSYLKTEKSFYNDIFDDLSEFVYDTLNEYYFPAFKNSENYKKLQKELEIDEILYSRLIQSNMISTEISE